jgi:hypothetical protein
MAAGSGHVAKSALTARWSQAFKDDLSLDSWGQREEAREGYEKYDLFSQPEQKCYGGNPGGITPLT